VTAAGSSYKGLRFPPEIISHCVWLYHRFPLSFRDVQELMLERGVEVSDETIRAWCERFGPEYANSCAVVVGGWATTGTSMRCSSR
jgi:putative transposase